MLAMPRYRLLRDATPGHRAARGHRHVSRKRTWCRVGAAVSAQPLRAPPADVRCRRGLRVDRVRPGTSLSASTRRCLREAGTQRRRGRAGDEQRDAAREALRGILRSIIIPPGDRLLQVTGNLGAMLDAAAGQKMPGRQAVGNVGCGGGI